MAAVGGLSKGLLVLLGLALLLFGFNHTRLLARRVATDRLAASRAEADRVQREAEEALLARLVGIEADPQVTGALERGDLAAVAATARQALPAAELSLQIVVVDESLRVVTSGAFKRGELWGATRGALEQHRATGMERDEETGALAFVAALRPRGGTPAALAVADPLGLAFVDSVKRGTGLDASVYTPDGIRHATTQLDADGDRLAGEPAARALWRRWERRQRPFVSTTVTRVLAVDPIRDRRGSVVAVRELGAPLPYYEGLRRLFASPRFLVEVLLLGLAALMAALLARPARR